MKRSTLLGLALVGGLFGSTLLRRYAATKDIVATTFAPIVSLAARSAIVGRKRSRTDGTQARFTGAQVARLLRQAWSDYTEQLPTLPPQPTKGSTMNLRLAVLTIGMFRALLDEGIERAYAVELVSDVSWRVYGTWGALWAWLTPRTLAPGRLARRVRPDGTFVLGFPFDAPAYVARFVPSKALLSFDMTRCPVADYFQAQGAVDLCVSAWCDLDYAIGEQQGLVLRRTTTLVEGAPACDFRWSRAAREADALVSS